MEYWEEEGKESGLAAFESKLRPKAVVRGEKFTIGEVTEFGRTRARSSSSSEAS